MASGDPLFSSFFEYFSFAACGLCFLHLSEGAALGIPKKLPPGTFKTFQM